MSEDKKKEVGCFRFGVISDMVNGNYLEPGELNRLISEKCRRKWQIPYSGRTRISRSTILRWIRLYKKGNGKLESLYPKTRSDKGESRKMDEETIDSLVCLRKEMPKATVKGLIRKMNERELMSPSIRLNISGVYRVLKQKNLMNPEAPKPEDRRKFEAELPNDLWQSDVMHGPRVMICGKLRKTYLIAIIDDHSRLISHGEFYLSEGLASWLAALEQALLTRGLPRKLYVDNGSAYRSKHFEHICASLGIALIHARPYKPQGKGKIERFFRTVRGDFIPTHPVKTLENLNTGFADWINTVYHERIHGGTKQSPFARFAGKMECVRTAPDNLKDHFRKTVHRRVAKDRTLSLNGRLYEAPVPLIGVRVEVLYHDHEPEHVEIMHKGKTYGYARLSDIHVNCRVKRDKNNNPSIESENPTPQCGQLW